MGVNKSKPMSLNKSDVKSVIRTGLVFLAPVLLMYLAQVTGALQTPNHRFSVNDFFPSTFTWGGIALYILNRITDLVKKFIGS